METETHAVNDFKNVPKINKEQASDFTEEVNSKINKDCCHKHGHSKKLNVVHEEEICKENDLESIKYNTN